MCSEELKCKYVIRSCPLKGWEKMEKQHRQQGEVNLHFHPARIKDRHVEILTQEGLNRMIRHLFMGSQHIWLFDFQEEDGVMFYELLKDNEKKKALIF